MQQKVHNEKEIVTHGFFPEEKPIKNGKIIRLESLNMNIWNDQAAIFLRQISQGEGRGGDKKIGRLSLFC